MVSWANGYVADVGYTHGFYRELAPVHLNFVALSTNKRGTSNAHGTYCELGCGQGVSTNVLAAGNPCIEFYANDFAPEQIAGARQLAREANLTNVHFSDASFAQYADDPDLPEFDVIVLHGIYSWVSADNRATIVEFLRRKLKVGGVVYVSYNTLPGWASASALRRLFFEHAQGSGGILPARVEKALIFADRLKDIDAGYFKYVYGAKERLKGIHTLNRSYLAHEYFNADWHPFYFVDVARDLGEAKLRYLGSANLLDHVDGANLTAAQQTMLHEVADPAFRETARDYITLQQFRKDVFGRGVLGLSPAEIQAGWTNLRLALTTPISSINYKVTGALGEVALQIESYAPVIEALKAGPRTLGELAQVPEIQAIGGMRIQEVLKVIIGAGWVQPCLEAEGDGVRSATTRSFNDAVMQRATWSQDVQVLASPVTGGGVSVERHHLLFLLALQDGHPNPPAFAWSNFAAQGQVLLKEGKPLESPEENLAELQGRYEVFLQEHLPILSRVGIT